MDSYRTVYRGGSGEIVEKKSRFIAEVFPVETEEQAMEYLEEVKKKYWDARHHCWAFIIGKNPGTERMSDDGEPAGTAGKPILEVLRGRDLTGIFLVVTRYFGGTLLGTGGLVRAYTAAAVKGLENSELITRTEGAELKITTDYTSLGKIQYLIAQHGLTTLDSVYTERVDLHVVVSEEKEPGFRKELMEGTNGQAEVETVQKCWFAQTSDGVKICTAEE